jgi:hypothetical protein
MHEQTPEGQEVEDDVQSSQEKHRVIGGKVEIREGTPLIGRVLVIMAALSFTAIVGGLWALTLNCQSASEVELGGFFRMSTAQVGGVLVGTGIVSFAVVAVWALKLLRDLAKI